MKNTKKLLGIIAMVAIIGFAFTACDDGGGGNGGGATSPEWLRGTYKNITDISGKGVEAGKTFSANTITVVIEAKAIKVAYPNQSELTLSIYETNRVGILSARNETRHIEIRHNSSSAIEYFEFEERKDGSLIDIWSMYTEDFEQAE